MCKVLKQQSQREILQDMLQRCVRCYKGQNKKYIYVMVQTRVDDGC